MAGFVWFDFLTSAVEVRIDASGRLAIHVCMRGWKFADQRLLFGKEESHWEAKGRVDVW